MGLKRAEVFPSKYLGKDDVQAGPIRGTVHDVVMEKIKGDGGDEDKAVLYFREQIKPMILNNTNWMCLEDAYGMDTDQWRTKPLEIYFDSSVMFGGKRTGGTRVRIPAGAALAAPPPAATNNVLKWADAVALAAAAALSEDQLKGCLKARGLTGYVAARDTATVYSIIAAGKPAEAEQGFGDDAPAEAIPF